jgi:hypothetical protein
MRALFSETNGRSTVMIGSIRSYPIGRRSSFDLTSDETAIQSTTITIF